MIAMAFARTGAIARRHLLQNPRPNPNRSIAPRVGAPVVGNGSHQLRHSKEYGRFPQFVYRKLKELGPPAPPSMVSSAITYATASAGLSRAGFGLVSWYLEMVKTRPILTKSVTCALIYTAADLSSQTVIGTGSYDLVRTSRMACYGLTILGPSLHYWFNFVSRIFPKRDLITTLKKIALGQTIYGPAMTVVFFSMNAASQGESGAEIVARLKRDLIPTMVSGVMYWPICDFVTFKFVPVHLQPLVSNSFSYLWTIYLTYMASLEKVAAGS